MMEKIMKRKKEWTNKGTNKKYVADSFIHSTSSNT